MTEQKSPLDQALDLMFYAPVGLAVTAREELPRLIEKGRQRVTNQVMMARMIGQFVVGQGQREATKVAKQANDLLVGLGVIPNEEPAPSPQPRAPVPQNPAGAGAGAGASNGKAAAAPVAALVAAPVAAEPAPTSDGLAIPGYDSLSASQVVQRLAGLAAGELEAVRGYEAITRGRRTILNRIAQLQTGAG